VRPYDLKTLAKKHCDRQWSNWGRIFGLAKAFVEGLAERNVMHHQHENYGNRPPRHLSLTYAANKLEVNGALSSRIGRQGH